MSLAEEADIYSVHHFHKNIHGDLYMNDSDLPSNINHIHIYQRYLAINMFAIDFTESLRLKDIGHDTFTNIHKPWTWNKGPVIPGGLLISLAAIAAYETIPADFKIANLQAQFIGGPSASKPLIFKVKRLSQGRRFAIRAVTIEQDGVVMHHASLSFVHTSPWTGPALKYSEQRRTNHQLEKIEIDDLEPDRTDIGPFMKFQRLPLIYSGESQ